MFNYIITKNFRKLRDNRYNFVGGLNAIRGANEQGKSTLLEAAAYAMQGVDGLREPLADVVTWGEKESTLKVELGFSVNSNQIVVRRSKAGAEIDMDGKLCATGQREVTKFVDNLLGAAPKTAGRLMLAKQTALRGALDDGPKATAELIEQLSNFSLIDEIVQLVQEHLPCGSPTGLEQQASTLASQMQASIPGELDTSAQQTALEAARAAVAKEQAQLEQVKTELGPARKAAEEAAERLRQYNAARQAVSTQAAAVQQSTDSLSKLNPVSSTSEESLAELRRQQTAAQSAAADFRLYLEMLNFQYPGEVWEGDRASFNAEVATQTATRDKALAWTNNAKVQRANLNGQLITGSACGLCGKDLTAIPEVAEKNGKVHEQLAALAAEEAQQSSLFAEAQATLNALDAIKIADTKLQLLLAKLGTKVSTTDTQVPPRGEWVGPPPSDTIPDYTGQIKAAEAELRRAAQDQGRKSELEASLARARTALAEAEAQVTKLGPQVSADRSKGLAEDLQTRLSYHQQRVTELSGEASRLAQEIRHLEQTHAMKVAAYDQLRANFEATSKQLEELALNNVLLKKLRAARPKVADRLWGIILPTTAFYFSQVRGTQSTVTRDEDGFKVDGRPITGLSGSALDALGLAIRIALVKTFLPNNDFLVLDEPAAACDDGRETNMLGTLTTAGFQQVLLVTHSQLADSFASQVISV
jgi:DNA repair exonuclease SbcCD ATPase subunit